MSEKTPRADHHETRSLNHEKHERLETAPDTRAEASPAAEADPLKQVAEARAEIEQNVSRENPLDRIEAAEEATATPAPTQVNHELKSITLRRELKNIQHKLPAGQRALSKVMHQPVIRAVSETASKSVTRPSGLLGGGLVAFIGSSSYLYLAKHVGFTYNYLVFLLLFILGFVVGLVLELIVWTLTARRRNIDL